MQIKHRKDGAPSSRLRKVLDTSKLLEIKAQSRIRCHATRVLPRFGPTPEAVVDLIFSVERTVIGVRAEDVPHMLEWLAPMLLTTTGASLDLSVHQELCYVRWLHTARAVAEAARRQPAAAEVRGPFESYRWAVYPRGRAGHPARGGPWYGVVDVSSILYRVRMVRSMHDSDLFRLKTDVWLEHL